MSPYNREHTAKVQVRRVIQPKPRSYSWWDAQAHALAGGTCPKCKGLTFGQYVPPTRATVNECAVIEHCRICGWERVVLQGRSGVPA